MKKKKLIKELGVVEEQRDRLLAIILDDRPEGFGWWYKRSLELAVEIKESR
tara:strand:- start:636 stop:788 length:153 start_codon:yes stop_codon:yes gene_type:complete